MKKRKPRIIQDKKLRGEWVESVFMARATEHGLPISKPWGEMCSYDFVIGKTRRFVSVQVKSTICRLKGGYECTVRGGHKAYPAGAFDFLAAYVVPEDAWYIIPAKLIRGQRSIALYPKSQTAKYEKYREAWHLLREAAQLGEEVEGAGSAEIELGTVGSANESAVREPAAREPTTNEPATNEPATNEAPTRALPGTGLARMEAAANYFRRYLERGIRPQKEREDGPA